jgi:hypothetical protein
MGLLNKFLKKKSSYTQSDNKGIYHNDLDLATEYWAERKKIKNYEPFLLYKFQDETDAVRALLEVECIKIAEDTEEIICTEPLIYGYYPVESGNYEVILCGTAMGKQLFENSMSVFLRNNGEKINERPPEDKKKKLEEPVIKKEAENTPSKPEKKETQVQPPGKKSEPEAKPEAEFLSDEFKAKDGKDTKIRIFRAANSKDAIAFLETKLVTKKDVVLIVKTPEGIFGRNYHGIYKVSKTNKK